VIVSSTLFWAVAPISSDDLWWHLSLGEAFSKHGPWLESAGVERGLTVGMVEAWLVTVLVAVLGLNGFGTWKPERSTYWSSFACIRKNATSLPAGRVPRSITAGQ
jgi:hypothetical protein